MSDCAGGGYVSTNPESKEVVALQHWLPNAVGPVSLQDSVHKRESDIYAAGCHECGTPYTAGDSVILNMLTGYSKHGDGCPTVVDGECP